MKILSKESIREADAFTIKHQQIRSADLMERAATAMYNEMKEIIEAEDSFDIYCGVGNNGGDGLVLARLLYKDKIPVNVYILHFSTKQSEDFQLNVKRLEEETKVKIYHLQHEKDFSPKNKIAVDAIFGTGLSKAVAGFSAEIIHAINKHYETIVAVDIPSGLFCDKHSASINTAIVKADITYSFQLPKLAFLFGENAAFVGHWKIVDIGLDEAFIEKTASKHFFTDEYTISPLIRYRETFSHKGCFGHGLLIAGSEGKMGAAVLAAKAALRSGIGLLSCKIPKIGYNIMQTAVAEAMCVNDTEESIISSVEDVATYNAIAIGPGIGKGEKTANALKLLIQNSQRPLILDADALNILSENKTWLAFLPKDSILTPHPKEFERLAGKSANHFEQQQRAVDFAIKNQVFLLLKGAYSCVACPDGTSYFNSSGNPGLACGGSGDVLCGVLLGLLAQGYSSKETAILGAFLHGLAADIAVDYIAEESLLPTDVIQSLSDAFLYLRKDF